MVGRRTLFNSTTGLIMQTSEGGADETDKSISSTYIVYFGAMRSILNMYSFKYMTREFFLIQ